MTDHLHPEPEPTAGQLLASAFVDGVLTADEHAEVQAAAATQALAQSFLHVREVLADTRSVVIDDAVRESAITAALVEFDTLHAATTGSVAAAAPVAPVIDLAARRRWPTRVLTAAAAVALLGVAGVAAFGSDDESGTADDARTFDAEVMAGDGAPSTIGAINGAASYAVPIDDPQQLLELPMPEATTADLPSDGTTDESAGGSDAKLPGPGWQCLSGNQVFLADIVYQGTPAIAARDTVTGVTQAIDEQCNVLVEVAP
ncbi:MAG: hypothetical protein Q7V57_13085 [Actinomycetota bacterium]|nr:hypothetical protein [Actinomycetota bacterium]